MFCSLIIHSKLMLQQESALIEWNHGVARKPKNGFGMKSNYNKVATKLDLRDAPFDIVLIDAENGEFFVYEHKTKNYLRLPASQFVLRYGSYLKRKMHIQNVPVRIVAVSKGIIFFIDRGIGGFATEDLLFSPWESIHQHDAKDVIQKAMELVEEHGSAFIVTDIESKSGKYPVPAKALMFQAQGDVAVFSSVVEESPCELDRWIIKEAVNDE